MFSKSILLCVYHFSSPGLSWNAMLKMTGVKLEKIMTSTYLLKKDLEEEFLTLLKDMLKHVFMTYKYMNDYDPKKQSTFISDLDMNNLCGWAMSEYLPYEGLKWLKNIDEFNLMSISEKVQ